MKSYLTVFCAVSLLFLAAGCDLGDDSDEGREKDPFKAVTLDWESDGYEYRFYTNDSAHEYATQKYSLSRSSYLDRNITVHARKAEGNPSASYGMRIRSISDSRDYISFLIGDDGQYIISMYENKRWTGQSMDDWAELPGLETGLGKEHTLSAVYDEPAGLFSFFLDGTALTHTVYVGNQYLFLAGFQCFTRTPSQSMPYDFRFRLSAPFISPQAG